MSNDFEKEYHSVLLGALLHDIGKLFIKPEKPEGKSHQEIGANLVRDNYKKLISEADFDEKLVDCLIRLHHYNDRKKDPISDPRLNRIVQLMSCADGCAAGERTKKDKEAVKAPDVQYTPLASLFAHIDLKLGFCKKDKNCKWKPKTYYYKPNILDWKHIFPEQCTTRDNAFKKAIKEKYQKLQENLKNELTILFNDGLKNSDIRRRRQTIITNIYSLFYKYLWSVPDDVGRMRVDVSLFDHIRITAALTAALYLYNQDNLESCHDFRALQNHEAILLIKGDLSGIQNYIFNIANIGVGGVAKRLRSRSFFLSNLVKIISHKILQEAVSEVQLPAFCEIIASGGNFIIVAPNLEEVQKQLSKIERSVNEWLFNEFQGDLSFSMAWLPIKTADLELPKKNEPNITRITSKLLGLNELLENKKQKKLSSWLQCSKDDSLRWNEESCTWKKKSFPHGLCRSCQKNPAASDLEQVQNAEDAFCKRCNADRRFSEKFVIPPRYIAFRKRESGKNAKGGTSFEYHFFDNYVVELVRENPAEIPADSYLVLCMHSDDLVFGHPSFLQPQANYVSRFDDEDALNEFCDNRCEKKKSECEYYQCITRTDEKCKDSIRASFPAVKPFDCLARSVGKDSEKLLGILKADVDWLGMIFSHGLGREASLSRIASLSRMMDLFFSGWLTEFLREKEEFHDTYTVYAGGDDLLIVSSWRKADKLAEAIAKNFRKYVACNPEITISAGIAVTKPKFPIAKSAKIADTHLEQVKNKSKNGLYLFGIMSNWFTRNHQDILDKDLRSWTEKIRSGYKKKALTKSVIYKLLQLSEMARRWQEGKNINDLRYISITSYIIGRDIEGNNPSKEESEIAKELRKILAREEGKHIFAAFRQPITRVLLATRKEKEDRTL